MSSNNGTCVCFTRFLSDLASEIIWYPSSTYFIWRKNVVENMCYSLLYNQLHMAGAHVICRSSIVVTSRFSSNLCIRLLSVNVRTTWTYVIIKNHTTVCRDTTFYCTIKIGRSMLNGTCDSINTHLKHRLMQGIICSIYSLISLFCKIDVKLSPVLYK